MSDHDERAGREDRRSVLTQVGATDLPVSPPDRHRPSRPALLTGLLVVVAALATGSCRSQAPVAGSTTYSAAPAADPGSLVEETVPAAIAVSDSELAALPAATTFGSAPAAPRDPHPERTPEGTIVHPAVTVPAYVRPGGPAFAAIPPQQLGSDTWLPVLDTAPGWAMVALPLRPNNSVGWIALDERVDTARTPYLITVERATPMLRLHHDGTEIGRWAVGVGLPASPTPGGRTFLLASIAETKATFSPIVLPLGTHSQTHLTYGGGPGTVAVHTWPDPAVFGRASSDGCVRVPPAALATLSTDVPLGTPVLIT